jgi:hypothetical protein
VQEVGARQPFQVEFQSNQEIAGYSYEVARG